MSCCCADKAELPLSLAPIQTMASSPQPADRKCFRVAIICALPREADAVALVFDQFWDETRDPYGRADGDTNTYITGRIGEHDAVLAILPSIGTNSAAGATAGLRSSFTGLKLAVIVGICGGVPRINHCDVFLGDVVVSKSIVQYDYGRLYPGHFSVKKAVEDSLSRANKDIRGLLAVCETELLRERLQVDASRHLKQLQVMAKKKRRRANYQYPGVNEDRLYSPDRIHKHWTGCDLCNNDRGILCEAASMASCGETECGFKDQIAREHPASDQDFRPEIHIGRIGSGNIVMKSGHDRDRIAIEHNLIAFEMEGAGAWDEVPCIIVKGICDYADSHKNDVWQDFAAATAASLTKAILGRYAVNDSDQTSTRQHSTL
jgi:nucleoside phosphorylase